MGRFFSFSLSLSLLAHVSLSPSPDYFHLFSSIHHQCKQLLPSFLPLFIISLCLYICPLSALLSSESIAFLSWNFVSPLNLSLSLSLSISFFILTIYIALSLFPSYNLSVSPIPNYFPYLQISVFSRFFSCVTLGKGKRLSMTRPLGRGTNCHWPMEVPVAAPVPTRPSFPEMTNR